MPPLDSPASTAGGTSPAREPSTPAQAPADMPATAPSTTAKTTAATPNATVRPSSPNHIPLACPIHPDCSLIRDSVPAQARDRLSGAAKESPFDRWRQRHDSGGYVIARRVRARQPHRRGIDPRRQAGQALSRHISWTTATAACASNWSAGLGWQPVQSIFGGTTEIRRRSSAAVSASSLSGWPRKFVGGCHAACGWGSCWRSCCWCRLMRCMRSCRSAAVNFQLNGRAVWL